MRGEREVKVSVQMTQVRTTTPTFTRGLVNTIPASSLGITIINAYFKLNNIVSLSVLRGRWYRHRHATKRHRSAVLRKSHVICSPVTFVEHWN